MPWISNRRVLCNDERELRQRDRAHWIAYRKLSGLIGFTFIIAYLKNVEFYSFHKPSFPFDEAIYGMLIASYVLGFILPQTILLWTEPDMEEPQ